MTMSIRRMSLGSGYRYLMSSVAQSDGAGVHSSALTAYYAETGTPPGRFLGAGLAGLAGGIGIPAGAEVTEEHLLRMLAKLQDPVTGQPLGTPPRVSHGLHGLAGDGILAGNLAEMLAEPGPDRSLLLDGAGKADRPVRSRVSQPVAGFDLTFSVPKSVSVAWALADPTTQALIYKAHHEALACVIAYAEQHVFGSRSGTGGVVQEDIGGVVAATFDHWDSRAGDPQLHTHVVIMNRAQCVSDGVWRSLDSRGLFKATVGLSELYNGVLSDYLTQRLGYGWQPQGRKHSTAPKWEIAGVRERLQAEFSQRSTAIEDTKDRLVDQFVATHGRSPTTAEVLRLRQQATLATRPDKHVHPLSDLVQGWRRRAAPMLSDDPESWVATLAGRNDLPLLRCGDLSEAMLTNVGRLAVDTVAGKRATFTRSNAFAEVLRQLHGVRFATADDRVQVAEHTTTLALTHALLVSPPDLAHTPAAFRRPDGTSRFRAAGHDTYATAALLDAETRLLDAGRSVDGPRLNQQAFSSPANTDHSAGPELSAEQRLAVEKISTSGRVLDVLVGPAGTGKSTTMSGLRAIWEHEHGPGSVVGLAPSATAAEVLADQVGIPTENTAKWLTENARNSERRTEIDALRRELERLRLSPRSHLLNRRLEILRAGVEKWSLHPGQLVIVDEASLAGTFTLDTLVSQARDAGAKVLLVGDWAQLSAVEAGGAFHMVVHDRDRGDVPELSDVRRFTHAWERQASVDLRIGLPDAADTYQAHGRVEGGDRDTMLDRLYDAWAADVASGNRSLMIAGDNQTVLELNQRARADRVTADQVQPEGVTTASGAMIGVGDLVVTRKNNRHLTTGTGWVKNGDQWVVTATEPDGAVTVSRYRGEGRTRWQVTLPADYASEHVDLGYATTAHGAQGRTVDTAHAYITATTRREVLYVAATRARDSNKLYVDTCYDPDPDTAHQPPPLREAADVLRQVLANPGADLSATETIRQEWANLDSLSRVWAEYQTLATKVLRVRYDDLITHRCGLTADQADSVRGAAAYGALVTAIHDADSRGLDIHTALPHLVGGRTLADADDVAAVLHERVDRWVRATRLRHKRVPDRIVGLLPQVDAPEDLDMNRALQERQTLIEHRTRELSEQAVSTSEPWVAQFGQPPSDPTRREHWWRSIDTVTAYRERWGASDGRTEERGIRSLQQEVERGFIQRAVESVLPVRPQPSRNLHSTRWAGRRPADRVIER